MHRIVEARWVNTKGLVTRLLGCVGRVAQQQRFSVKACSQGLSKLLQLIL